MRLFVALSLPEDLRDGLTDLQSGIPEARWVDEDNLHLTLRFIGEVDGGTAQDIDAALLALRQPAFELTLEGLGQFGEGRKLRALWAGVQREERLFHLQAKIERALQSAGLPPETRKYKPHVTLARFRGDAGPALPAYMASHLAYRSQAFKVSSFCLYSSFLSHGQPVYRVEAEYPLVESLDLMAESSPGMDPSIKAKERL